MSSVIVERPLAVPLENEDYLELTRNVACFRVFNVRFVASYLSERHDRIICHFEAPDVESVRHALRGAGLEVHRIWAAKVVRRGDPLLQVSPS